MSDTAAASSAQADAVATLRSTVTIRERCANITRAVDGGASPHFTLARDRLDAVADRIAALTRASHPALRIPYHSRWRHFEAGGVDRKAELDALLAGRSAAEQARARIDLTVVSVLLDAGAGPGWRYAEAGPAYSRSQGNVALPLSGIPSGDGRLMPASLGRSEGLGVASFRAFLQGRFSSDGADRLRVDAAALQRIGADTLADIFQADAANPLVGLDGRAELLRRLGAALQQRPARFGPDGRPGRLFDALQADGAEPVSAARLLRALLDAFSGIWPNGQWLAGADGAAGLPLGDVWPHPHAGGAGASAGWVPFHKLSQWLAYSLLEPFEWAGVPVGGLDALTGLPEYRNGGLLLDAGVIVPRDSRFAEPLRTPADRWVIEWRALTVSLLDELAPRVRQRLGLTAQQMPLACVLEGGSWAAGRQIAAEHRPGGGPPVSIDSDGTVF